MPDPSSSTTRNSSSVVPGYVVDSRTTKAPFARCGAIARPVSRINERSGSRFLFSGVGTQMMTASTSLMRLKSVEAENFPEPINSAIADC